MGALDCGFRHRTKPCDVCILKMQVGTGSRAEKIRTYNFKDNRVTDHRLKTNYELTSFLGGDIDNAIQACVSLEQQELLEELAESVGAPAG
ncbi:peptide chain release factor APG3, chloroplastic-like [Pyrus x bretschneideri]|uniref:peptide chain release factor APG3, chloroplastic-like n=1 Tax=Pyrus x bretschneideri TaxID=225117 RepID=UPI00202E3798|nr:peptide chain release factor APG3, chloroplastic-like [Pyrus x bretschneideri]